VCGSQKEFGLIMIPGFINICNSTSFKQSPAPDGLSACFLIHYNFFICFLTLPISISWLLSSLEMLANWGIGPSIAAMKLDCVARRAGGTKIPNQRNGSTLFAGFLSSSGLCDGSSDSAVLSFESLLLGSLVLAAMSCAETMDKLDPSSEVAELSA
jgi:hypothetical protein